MRIAAAALIALLAPAPGQAQETAVPDAPQGGDAQSALEAQLAAMRLCEPLGREIAGMSLGLGQVRSVRVRRADLRLEGDGVTLEVAGRLTCRGPERPTDEDLSADIAVELAGILSRCEITETDVAISGTEGEMAWALDLAAPVIQGLLISRIEEEARKACNDFAN